jgi:cytochrome b subunit of formate dehydrogenase
MTKIAANYGLVLGFVLTGLNVLHYVTKLPLDLVNMVVFISGIYYCILKYRDEHCSGIISYKRSLQFGALLSMFVYIVLSAYNYMYITLIDPESFRQAMENIRELFRRNNLPDSGDFNIQSHPVIFVLVYVFEGAVIGTIISAIVSLFTKRENH